MNDLPQTIQEYKKVLRELVIPLETIREYGDLRKKQTWENAYESLTRNPSLNHLQEAENPVRTKLSEQQRDLLFGPTEYKADSTGQLLLFELEELSEPPDPDDYSVDYEWHYQLWAERYPEVAEALDVWSASNGLNPDADVPAVPIYCNGIFRPIVDEWEIAEFLPAGKLNPKIQKYFEEVDYSYPLEYLIMAFYSCWKVQKLLSSTEPKFSKSEVLEVDRESFVPPKQAPGGIEFSFYSELPPRDIDKVTITKLEYLPVVACLEDLIRYCRERSPPELKDASP